MAVAIVQTADVAGVLAVSNICTYTNVAIGTASVDRIVVVCCGIESASIPQSATIGGVAMSATPNGNFGSMSSMLFYKAVPAGTTATIAITFSGAVAAAENHITVYAVTGAAVTPLVVGAGNGSTDMDSSAPLSTGALTVPTSGGIVACAVGATNTTTMTWSANVAADINASHLGNYTFGTALGTSAITATAVTCTGSVNNQDGALGWLVFGPAVWPVPGVGTLSLAGTTPTRAITELVTAIPAAGSLSLTAAAPTVSMPADTNLVPAAAALALSGSAPTASTFVAGQYDETGETAAITLPGNSYTEVEFGLVLDFPNLSAIDKLAFRVYANGAAIEYDVTPEIAVPAIVPAASLTLTGVAPSLVVNAALQPAAGLLTLSGTVPALLQTFQYLPDAGSLTLSADAPSAVITANFEPAAGSLVLSAEAPSVVLFGTVDYNYVPGVGSLTVSAEAPELTIPVSCVPDAATLTLSADAPVASVTTALSPAAGNLTLSGVAPSLSQNLIRAPAAAALALSADAPASVKNEIRAPAAAALALSSEAATLEQTFNLYRDPAAANLVLTGEASSASVKAGIEPETASLDLSADAPSISFGAIFQPASAVLALVAEAPVPRQDIILTVAPAALILSATTPSFAFSSTAENEWLVCTSITINPELATDVSMAAELAASVDMKEC